MFVMRLVTERVGAMDCSITNSLISVPNLANPPHAFTCKRCPLIALRGNTKHVKVDVTIRARRGQDECGVVMLVVVFKLIEVRGSRDLFCLLRILAVAEYRGEIVAT